MASTLSEITKDFQQLTSDDEKINLTVLLLHDVTGLKKKDIRLMLEYGPQLVSIYSEEQDFSVNKKPEAKKGKKTSKKKKKA